MMDNNPPSRVGDVLKSLFYQLGIDTKIKQVNILKSWSQAVGKTISKHSQPVTIRKGNLFVKVDSSAWLTQLYHFKEKIISEFNKNQEEEIIKDIHFSVGSVSHSSGRKRKVNSRKVTVKLEKKELDWVEETAKRIGDKKLEELLKRILKKYKQFKKTKGEKANGKNSNSSCKRSRKNTH
ncbi:DUF721 domain-containing protein [Candidatus Aerophobetes bacterium]|nr:DUF721 domain-containing protein [Candidatus Aerophobetes bacterium]